MFQTNIQFPRSILRLLFSVTIISSACNSTSQTTYKTIGSIERTDPALEEIISKDAIVEIIADGFEWSEGPLWVDAHKMLLFSDIPRNSIYKWTEAKGKELYLQPSGFTGAGEGGREPGSNGLLLNSKGQLVLCQHGDRQIALMDAPLDSPRADYITIANNYQGKKFDSPNDAVYRSNGDLFITDPPYGLPGYIDDTSKAAPYQGVYKIAADGAVSLLVDSIKRPNGIAFLPGEKTLIVANSEAPVLGWYAFDIAANDSLINPRMFHDATEAGKTDKGGPDGLKVDSRGNVFATGPGGVWIFDKNAKVLGKIRVPEACSNVALADNDKTLYITADMYVLRVKMR